MFATELEVGAVVVMNYVIGEQRVVVEEVRQVDGDCVHHGGHAHDTYFVKFASEVNGHCYNAAHYYTSMGSEFPFTFNVDTTVKPCDSCNGKRVVTIGERTVGCFKCDRTGVLYLDNEPTVKYGTCDKCETVCIKLHRYNNKWVCRSC